MFDLNYKSIILIILRLSFIGGVLSVIWTLGIDNK